MENLSSLSFRNLKNKLLKAVMVGVISAIVVTPVALVFAQEAVVEVAQPQIQPEAPANEVQAPPIETPQADVPEIGPIDEISKEKSVEEEPKLEKEELPKAEKSKEELAKQEPEAMALMAPGNQGDGVKFSLPTQPEASVDQSTGALIYDYPIALPEGRAGMTPELSLKYDSRSASKPDSIAGLGWDVSIPFIQRERSAGNHGLYDKAIFSSSISGNLIATTDTSSSQYTVYRPESDSGEYLKYTFNSNNTWTVTGKDGKTYTFGGAANSRQDNPSDSTKIYKWMISKIADTHGNEIQYSYIKDNGQIYPSQIVYTYHAQSPAVNTVNFSYTTPASYGATVYNSGFPVTTFKLLNTIVATTTIDSLTSYYTYTLDYTDAQFLKHKTLRTVTRTNNYYSYEFNQAFNDVTTFDYSIKTPGWEQGTHSLANNLPQITDNPFRYVRTADFDKNGFTDVLVTMQQSSSKYYYLMMNDGVNFTESSAAWSLPDVHLSQTHAIADVNGDSLPDFHPRGFSQSESHAVYINTGSSFAVDDTETWEVGNYVPEAHGCGPNVGDAQSFDTNTFLHDINLDGKNDILYFGGSSDFRAFLNNGNGFTSTNDYDFTPASGANFVIQATCSGDMDQDGYQTLIDINGDGLLDYYHVTHGTYINTGSGFAYSAAYDMDIDEMDRSGFADINADGLLDYIGFKWFQGSNSCSRTLFNNGQGFTPINPTNFPANCDSALTWGSGALQYYSSNPSRFGSLTDITADGLPDVFGTSTVSSNYGKVRAINNGLNEWTDITNSSDQWNPLASPLLSKFIDVNSDGILDFITYSTSWDGSSSHASKVYTGKQSVTNRLNKITTPLGAQTVIDYSTAKTDASDIDASPMPVVKKVTIQNIGAGQPSMVTQYSYDKGVYVVDQLTGQKRFAGFHKVTSTESGVDLTPLRVNESYFHQANGSDSSTSEPTDTDLTLIGKSYYSVTKNPTGTLKKENWNKYGTYALATDPVSGRESKFVYGTESVVKTTDPSTSVGTAESYVYNNVLGERTELRNLGFVTVGSGGAYTDINGDTRYEFTEYSSNSGGTIVSPKQEDIRTGINEVDTISRTNYFYDNQSFGQIGTLGELTKQSQWVNGNGTVVADTTYTYDAFGNIASTTNPRGAISSYTYDSSKSLVLTETNHLNHITSYEYGVGQLKKITDPNGRVITYSYSSIGLLYRTNRQNVAGSNNIYQTLNQENGIWSIQTETEPVNSVLDRSWQVLDGLGRPVKQINRKMNFDTIVYGGDYLKQSITYDALGRKVSESAPYGLPTNTYNWSDLVPVVVPTNLVTTTTYDVFDRPISVVNAIGTSTNSYAGTEVTTTDANNHQKKTKSDAYGNLIEVKEYNASSIYTTNYEYDNRNLLIKITDALGNVRNFTHNNAGWLTSSEDLHAVGDGSFGSSSFTYDVNGNQLVETQPNGVTVTRVYDMLDRPSTIDGSSTTATDFIYTYDTCTYGKGRLCAVAGTLPNSVTMNKSYVYGISGVPTSVSMTTLGNIYTTNYLYTLSDKVKQITHPNGTVVRYVFGDWAKPSAMYTTLPGQSETLYATVSYHHTEKPSVTTITNGPTTTYTYDDTKLYRLTRKWTGTTGITTSTVNIYPYSGDGNVSNTNTRWSRVWPASTGTTATYNTTSTSVGAGLSFTLRRGFIPFNTSSLPDNATITSAKLKIFVTSKLNADNDGNDFISISQGAQASNTSLTTTDYNDVGDIGNLTQGVDSTERKDITNIATNTYTNFQLNAVGKSWISLTGATKFAILEGHDVFNDVFQGSPTSWNSINFNTSEASGTSTDPVLEVTYTVPSNTTIQEYNYSYDNVNNITAIAEPGLTKSYNYDDLNRLTQAVHTPTPGSPTTYSYTYDAVGNITSANGQSYTYSGAGKTNPHAVTSVGASNYTYDDNGNIATAPNQAFTYNWQNQATSILIGGTTNVTSAYDESGNRFLYQTPTNTEIQIDDGYVLRNGAPEISLSLGGSAVGVLSNGTAVASVTDHLGTPIKQVNSSGVVVENVSYDPYGKVLTQSGSLNTKKGYTGHEEDVDTGLVYAQARYYNPSIGRFVSQDPVFWQIQRGVDDPQLMNSYSYARNNPLTYLDPNGEWPTLAQVSSFLNRTADFVNRLVDNGPAHGLGIYDIVNPATSFIKQVATVIDSNATKKDRIISGLGVATVGTPPSQKAGPILPTASKLEWGGMWTKGAASNPITNLGRHADDHAALLGIESISGYYKSAKSFVSEAVDNGYQATINTKGNIIRIWDKATERFGSYEYSNGTLTPKTFMKSDSSNYWNTQQRTHPGQRSFNIKKLIK